MEQQPLRAGGTVSDVIDRYQTTVYGLALARLGSPADADDVFQEVFLAYFQSGKTFRDEEHRKAWLLRTTMNLCRRVTHSSWRKKTLPLEEEQLPPASLPGAGGEPGVAGPHLFGGELPPPPIPLLFPGAVHPRDRPRPLPAPWDGAYAPVPW